MHCHTKEGSIDGKIPIHDYIEKLQSLGFSAMVVTDHDSYNGYRTYKKQHMKKEFPRFTVIKGIEYDTMDAGHILCILPDGVNLPIMELRGLPAAVLIEIVHFHGGILGPAHPCGVRYQSFFNTLKHNKMISMISQFDFLEGYNACEEDYSNKGAERLGEEFGIPMTGGSDSHKLDCVGLAYTDIPEKIRSGNDLIAYFKKGAPGIQRGGSHYPYTTKAKLGPFNEILVQLFWFYNKLEALRHMIFRNIELRKMYYEEILKQNAKHVKEDFEKAHKEINEQIRREKTK